MTTKSFWFHIKSLFQTPQRYNGIKEPYNVDIQEHHEQKLKELPEWIRDRGVEHLKKLISDDDKIQIGVEYKKDNRTWWAMYHHGWGTAIRNSLRDNVCLDDELPSGIWDDYYVRLVEIACGIKS